jgi:hypothetical protein
MNNGSKGRSWSPSRLSSRSQVLLVAASAFLLVVAYAGAGIIATGGGFPLDDSWIHQTYARNLAMSGRWQYGSGQISAGSTSPLWTLLLAIGHLAHLPKLLWANFLGWVSLAWLGRSAMRFWTILWPERASRAWLAGLMTVTCWQLVWAAASGMETLLFAALALQVLLVYVRPGSWGWQRALLLGIGTGASMSSRPEGLLLLASLAVGLLTINTAFTQRVRFVALLATGAAAFLIPYFSFNLLSSGHIWPNTFYAKQAEYALSGQQPLTIRFITFIQLVYFTLGGTDLGWRGISGVHWLLIPGLIAGTYWAIRTDWISGSWRHSLPLGWAVGHIFIYAWRLPVTYQHGRYFWPVLPALLIYGLLGWGHLSERLSSQLNRRFTFIARSVSQLTYGTLALIFLLFGLQAYVQDVSLVESEMVATAKWLRDNTPDNALIAAHDIGAIGYYAERPILDLAGLVSPEVVPLLADEKAMADYINQQEVDYLVTAPGWTYIAITRSPGAIQLFVSDHEPTRMAGLNNTAVYRLTN